MRKFFFVVSVLFGIYLTLMVYDTFYRMKNFSKEKTPYLYITPVARKIEPPRKNFTETTSISYHHLKFKAPWGNGIEKKYKYIFGIKFPQKIFLGITDSPPELLPSVLKANPKGMAVIYKRFGEEYLRSEYLYKKLILSSKPNFFTMLKPLPDTWQGNLLVAKSIILPVPARTGIFDFEVKNLRGFQFGGPKRENQIMIELFDKNRNDYNYSILINGKNITQDEIDFILSSLSTY